MMRNFLLGQSASEVGSTAVDSAASSSSAASSASGAHDPAQMGACLPTLYEQEMEEAADDDAAGPSTVPADPPPPPPIVTLSPDSVLAELDNEDQVESMDGKESVMFIYLHAVVRQLKKECSTTGKAVPGDVEWLLPLLKEDGYWLRAHKARHICKKLGVTFTCEAYYTDVHVWVPQLEFGIEAMPSCVSCKCTAQVQVHGWSAKGEHVGRRVCGMQRHYFMLTQRYICTACQAITEASRPRFTFYGWDKEVLLNLPHGYGLQFPAVLSHRSGIDKLVMDQMRVLFDAGVRPERFSDMLVELHAKQHTLAHIKYEHTYECEKAFNPLATRDMFSSFGDPLKYAGAVPTGSYLATCYKAHHCDVRPQFDAAMKKVGSEGGIKIDVSYKLDKHIKKYHGVPLSGGTMTVLNGLGEIRSQWSVGTDAHAQHTPPLLAFIETEKAHGRQLPSSASTDKPHEDGPWLIYKSVPFGK
jgi:hypothetical protein